LKAEDVQLRQKITDAKLNHANEVESLKIQLESQNAAKRDVELRLEEYKESKSSLENTKTSLERELSALLVSINDLSSALDNSQQEHLAQIHK
jgi:chromosome segregation ATPase